MTRDERLTRDGDPDPILFYQPSDPDWGVFSNFSNHPVVMRHPFTDEMVTYPTSEHRFQAMKAVSRIEHDFVSGFYEPHPITPGETKRRGRATRLRDGWGTNYGDLCWYVMVEVLRAKYDQHPEMRAAIKATADHVIYEDSPTDDIWGWRYMNAHSGKNLLGRALMDLREWAP